MEIGNLPEKEFRIMIVKMIQDLRIRMEAKIDKMQEIYIYILIFVYLWLCWVFVSVRGLSLVVASRGALHRDAQASHYHGLSCCGAQAPDAQAQ